VLVFLIKVYQGLVGKPEEKNSLEGLGIGRRTILKLT
jgi:hypothetical protein